MANPRIRILGGTFVADESGAKNAVEFDEDEFEVTHDSDGITVALKATAPVSAGKLTLTDGGELTIADGAVTVTGSLHTVDTEEDGAADDLDTIAGGTAGQILVLAPADPARVVTVTDADNIALSTDFIMDDAASRLTLIYDAVAELWFELARANGGS